MKTVEVLWTPSASSGVESQSVAVFNTETLETYLQESLVPQATRAHASVPEGVTIQASITTTRGEEHVTDVSNPLDVGFGPLQGVSDLSLQTVDMIAHR